MKGNFVGDGSASHEEFGQGGTFSSALTKLGLVISGIAKTFDDRTVLHPLDLDVKPGEIHALLGQNGSGKSTLIKILSGYHAPDRGGQVQVDGQLLQFGHPHKSFGLGLRFVHQDLGLIPALSVLDNLALGRGFETRLGTIKHKHELARAESALEAVGLGVSPMTMVSELSAAECTGVALARALDPSVGDARVLVLDEPTATLPDAEVEHLHTMLRRAAHLGVAILYVTHHLDEVFRLADRLCVLRDGSVVRSCAVGEADKQSVVHSLIGTELEEVTRTSRSMKASPRRDVSFRMQDIHAGPIRGITLEVEAGEILGVYGLTGSGSESLLAVAFGAKPRESGEIFVNDVCLRPSSPTAAILAGVGYLPPDRKVDGSFMTLTAMENLTLADLRPFWRRPFMRANLELREVERWFEILDVRPIDGARNVQASFSGGNQQKIVMGKWLRVSPRVLLLDEPTAGVDVGAKAELHRQIMSAADRGSAVIVGSSDIEELASICDRVAIVREGRVAGEVSGGDVSEHSINRKFHDIYSGDGK